MIANDVQRPVWGTAAEGAALSDLSARNGLPAPNEGYVTAADGTRLRYAHWRTPNEQRQGSILYLNGRTEFIEKTTDVYGILCRSGLDVWTFDWRGQGLSTRALADPEKGHVTDYQHYLDDLDQVIRDVSDLGSTSGKRILLAHSMGGHIGLRHLHDRPEFFDCAVFSAPMIDIAVNNAPLRMVTRTLIALGLGERYAPGTKGFRFIFENPDDPSDNGTLDDYRQRRKTFDILTQDAKKFMEIQRHIRINPALALGGPTAGWLDATFRSINHTWAPGYAEAIDTPVLMVAGGRDRVVDNARQEAMTKRLPNGQFHMIDNAAHELLVECDDVRSDFLERVAAFADITIELPGIDMSGCIRR